VSESSSNQPIAVIGAGAAGLAAAIFAARAGARVVLIETKAKPGAKIRVSGGGRCNILPSVVDLSDFHTHGSPRAMRNVLFSWPLAEVRSFFEDELDVPLYIEEDTGKVFPKSDRAQDVVAALMAERERLGVELRAPFRVVAARRAEDCFELESGEGEVLRAAKVILATGGLSLPKTGSDGGGFELAKAFGHEIEPTYPALVPLGSAEAWWRELAGISLVAKISARTANGKTIEERQGDFLFTHRGFSGPVVLDMSRHVARAASGGDSVHLEVRWRGDDAPAWDDLLKLGGKRSVSTVVREVLPRRLAEGLIRRAGVDVETKLGDLSKSARQAIVRELEACDLGVSGNEGYRTAEVTAGGVPLSELATKTLESRKIPGLYFAGEIVDVIGRIGGFNFLWAWVSGRKAGEAAAKE